MLKQIHGECGIQPACVAVRDAKFPKPFLQQPGLEFSSPARGVWNIVHIGMLLPQAHLIFVCPEGCLRGVVQTADEMNASGRLSTIDVRENNVLEGNIEKMMVDGVSDIIGKLPQKPPAVLIYSSCVHHFIGCDLTVVYKELRKKFPDIAFGDCYMNPIMRKTGLTPEQLMRRQLYKLLQPREFDTKSVNIIGNCNRTDESSELVCLIHESGYGLKDIVLCKTYGEYLKMAESPLNITTLPIAHAAGVALQRRLSQEHVYLPLSYSYKGIEDNLHRLSDILHVPERNYSKNIAHAEFSLHKAKKIIGDCPVAIDYTATPRPLSLARLLCEHGFAVARIYADELSGEEKGDFLWLKEHRPEIEVCAATDPRMRVAPNRTDGKVLAIGQKAAYFTGTDNFVNMVEGGGMYGFDGISRLAGLMTDAFLHEKDTRKLIQIKGLGCGCCL